MKTLQTITTCLLLFMSITATGQEKQNDATWEECYEFVKYNISYANDSGLEYTLNTNDLEKSMIMSKGGEFELIWSLNLNNIKEAKIDDSPNTPDGCIYLYSYGYQVRGFHTVKKSDRLSICFRENEIRNRMLKAFKQLAYLNGKERNNSKF